MHIVLNPLRGKAVVEGSSYMETKILYYSHMRDLLSKETYSISAYFSQHTKHTFFLGALLLSHPITHTRTCLLNVKGHPQHFPFNLCILHFKFLILLWFFYIYFLSLDLWLSNYKIQEFIESWVPFFLTYLPIIVKVNIIKS